MKRKTKSILLWLVVAFFLSAGVVRAKYPDLWNRLVKSSLQNPLIEEISHKTAKQVNSVGEVLSQQIEDTNEQISEKNVDIPGLIENISGNSTLIKETRAEVEKVVTQKIEKVQELPDTAAKEVKKKVKKELYQEICQGWLEEE